MKKIIILLLCITILTSCTLNSFPIDNVPTDIPTDAESTTPDDTELTTVPNETTTPEDIETTTPEEVETTVPEDTETTTPEDFEYPPPVLDVYGPGDGERTTLKTLYEMLIKRSEEFEDYKGEEYRFGAIERGVVRALPEENILITLDDFNINLEGLDHILWGDNLDVFVYYPYTKPYLYIHYDYLFREADITVRYAPEMYSPDDFTSEGYSSISYVEGGLSAFLSKPEVAGESPRISYVEYVDGYPIFYRDFAPTVGTRTDYYVFYILTEDFGIYVNLQKDALDNPDYAQFAKYFSEDTYQDAVRQLIEVIENRA